MAKLLDWDEKIGRRVRLRDLYVFLSVVEFGSMGRAAAKLGVATPSVSQVIAGLEHAVGAPLFDRSPQGVVTTRYGEALLARARAAFDELRQGMRDIEFLGDAQSGELRVGCPESIAAGLLLPILRRLTSLYPRLRFDIRQVRQPTIDYPELHDRKVDVVLARWGDDPRKEDIDGALDVEILLDDPFRLVASRNSKWARRRKLDLADLVDARFVVPAADAWGGALVVEAFRRRGLPVPRLAITTLSISLRSELTADGDFITLLTRSVVRTFNERYGLKILPIELPAHRSPLGIVMLKNRTPAPVMKSFIRCAREVAKSIASQPGSNVAAGRTEAVRPTR